MKNIAGKSSVIHENDRYEELRNKLTFGINLAIQRMIERSKLLDEEIVIAQDGKVVRLKAREL